MHPVPGGGAGVSMQVWFVWEVVGRDDDPLALMSCMSSCDRGDSNTGREKARLVRVNIMKEWNILWVAGSRLY